MRVAYSTVLDNPSDAVSLMRIVNRPRRGIGDTSLQRLVGACRLRRDLALGSDGRPGRSRAGDSAATKAVRGFRTTMESLMSSAQELEIDELVEAVLERSGTIEAYEAERTIEARGRVENLQELVGVAREFRAEREEPTLSSFLQEVSLVSDQDTLAGDGSLVTLMTIHNAKGLEFRAVFMIGMEEGIFPHARSIEDNEIEEERRLAYVGMTRAMERLVLTHASARSLLAVASTTCLRGSSTSCRPSWSASGLRPTSWSGYASSARQLPPRERRDGPELHTGDSVRHGSLGEGVVVTRIEAGGIVTVRFAADGSERRLMLEYAQLEKLD